ncbi:MAG: hypothetical protein R3B40_06620 [Polyangiales bacterium]|nr:hypothetical protein [Myxococcales bacterium]MCB9657603.1 hypothetical protein [Sandaracinaceae bacterium]
MLVVVLAVLSPRGPGHVMAQARGGTTSGAPGASTGAAAPASAAGAAGASAAADLDALAARFDHEPTVAEVLQDALAYHAQGLADPTRAARRSRRSAWLPELRLRARRGRQRDANATQSGTNLSTDDDAIVEGALVFDLPRTVYSGEEATWSREARAQAAARTQLVRLVVGLYFERRRLQLERELGARDLPTLVRLVEIEATLDGLTGGRFGERLRAAQAAADEP